MAKKRQAENVTRPKNKAAESKNPQVKRTRAYILESTRYLLIEKGYRNVTVDGVSGHSGASRSTIYRHWPKIEDLLFDAFAGVVGEPFEAPDSGDYKQDLLCINKQYQQALQNSTWVKLLPAFIEASQTDTHCAELLSMLVSNSRATSREILVRAQERSQIDDSVSIEWVVDIITAPLTYRVLLSNGAIDEEGYLEYLIEAATTSQSGKKPKSARKKST